jgi:hypothetical protein
MKPTVRLTLAALAAYSGIAFCALYAIAFTTGTHWAGFDAFNYHWNFWFIRHVASTPGLSLYANDFAMFPAMSNYGYHAFAAAWFPLWAVLEPLFSAAGLPGTLWAFTILIFTTCTLNGWLTFVWLRTLGIGAAWALVGGAALQIFPIARYFYFNTHLNLMTWFWLPGLLLLWAAVVSEARSGRFVRLALGALAFGTALWGLGLTDLQFPIFAAFVLVPVGLRDAGRLLLTDRAALARLAAFAAGAVALALALLVWAGPLRAMAAFTGRLEPGPAEDRPGIALPGGLLGMSETWWEWSTPSLGLFISLYVLAAVVAALLALRSTAAARPRDARWWWFALMLPPLVFALGPTLTVLGREFPLPYRLLHAVTDGMFRMPWRLAPIAVLCGAAFAGLVFTHHFASRRAASAAHRSPSRASRPRSIARIAAGTGVLLVLFATVRVFEPGPLQPIPPDYAFYHAIGRETEPPLDRAVVLEVPTAAGTGEVLLGDPRAIQLQWYGIVHGKRMLNGFISRAPIDPIWPIVADDPLLAWLGGRRPLDSTSITAISAGLRERVFAWPIGYVVVHGDLIGRESSTLVEVVGFLNSQSFGLGAEPATDLRLQSTPPDAGPVLCPPLVEGDAIVYRTRWHPAGCTPPYTRALTGEGDRFTLDIGAGAPGPAGDWAAIGAGWHYAEPVGPIDWRWADAGPAWLYADLPPGRYTVTVEAQAFSQPRTVSLEANGASAGSIRVEPGVLAEYTFPAEFVHGTPFDQILLGFRADGALTPASVGLGDDARPLAFAVSRVMFDRVGP